MQKQKKIEYDPLIVIRFLRFYKNHIFKGDIMKQLVVVISLSLISLNSLWAMETIHTTDTKASRLHQVAVSTDPESLNQLASYLEEGDDVNAVDAYKNTPLHRILDVYSRQTATKDLTQQKTQLLLSKGSSLTIKNNNGQTVHDILQTPGCCRDDNEENPCQRFALLQMIEEYRHKDLQGK